LDARSDLTDLDHANPELAARLRRVRDRLNTAGDDSSTASITERRRWWAEHDGLLAQIRQHPGFTRFLLPPRLDSLQSAVAGGAVVLLNAGRYRADAVIITAEADPVPVPLPDLRLIDVVSHLDGLVRATQDATRLSGRLRRQRVLTDVLGWLWATAVRPVLDALPVAAQPSGPLPRVWWMPVGLLGLFPLHAAGPRGQSGALDRVVSSYIPTLRTLAHTRARPAAVLRRQLTVALEHVPGLPDLPGTAAEATALHARHRDSAALADRQATIRSVLNALPEATWAHFACHAYADLDAPSRSGLHLYDGALLIPEIGRLRLDHAELAYLSACSTARGGVDLADESLHLASAFQLAGFRHVIATLWPLDDGIAVTAARAFYDQLPNTSIADAAPTALHQVVRDLRDRYPDRPDLWASLVHSGP
jgi:hypothetical protein